MKFYKTKQWEKKRLVILKNDNYLCQECIRYGTNRGAQTVHHVNPILERFDLRLTNWNLISLCNKCHEKMHNRKSDKLTKLGEWWRDTINRKHTPCVNKSNLW